MTGNYFLLLVTLAVKAEITRDLFMNFPIRQLCARMNPFGFIALRHQERAGVNKCVSERCTQRTQVVSRVLQNSTKYPFTYTGGYK